MQLSNNTFSKDFITTFLNDTLNQINSLKLTLHDFYSNRDLKDLVFDLEDYKISIILETKIQTLSLIYAFWNNVLINDTNILQVVDTYNDINNE